MTNHAVSNRADLRERTKTMRRHGDRRGQIADFRGSFETINWLYLLFKCGIKTKTHFEWLLWHWSSLGQLNLKPIRPNGLVGYKVPTDLVKISVKEATHMGFHYIFNLNKPLEKQSRHRWCAHGHISATTWYIMGWLSNALWGLWDRFDFCFGNILARRCKDDKKETSEMVTRIGQDHVLGIMQY